MSPTKRAEIEWDIFDPPPEHEPRRGRRTDREREADDMAKAAERIGDLVPPLAPVTARFVQCEPAENGIRRTSKCAKADATGKCSACTYADRACADSIAAYGWCPVEWERT